MGIFLLMIWHFTLSLQSFVYVHNLPVQKNEPKESGIFKRCGILIQITIVESETIFFLSWTRAHAIYTFTHTQTNKNAVVYLCDILLLSVARCSSSLSLFSFSFVPITASICLSRLLLDSHSWKDCSFCLFSFRYSVFFIHLVHLVLYFFLFLDYCSVMLALCSVIARISFHCVVFKRFYSPQNNNILFFCNVYSISFCLSHLHRDHFYSFYIFFVYSSCMLQMLGSYIVFCFLLFSCCCHCFLLLVSLLCYKMHHILRFVSFGGIVLFIFTFKKPQNTTCTVVFTIETKKKEQHRASAKNSLEKWRHPQLFAKHLVRAVSRFLVHGSILLFLFSHYFIVSRYFTFSWDVFSHVFFLQWNGDLFNGKR